MVDVGTFGIRPIVFDPSMVQDLLRGQLPHTFVKISNAPTDSHFKEERLN